MASTSGLSATVVDEGGHDPAQRRDGARLRRRRRSRGARSSQAWAAASTSMAIAASASRMHSRAWRAAIMPMLTWSSWPAEDVIESTAAGCARLFISETRDAAVYWQTMNPELTPASPTRNGGQAVRGLRVEEPEQPALGDRGETDGRGRERVAGERDGLAVEIPAGEDLAGLEEHDGVVRDRGQLDLEGPRAVGHDVAEGTVHLGRATDRIGVLDDVVARAVRGEDLAARQQAHQVPRRGQLAGVRAQAHDPSDQRPGRSRGSPRS